MNIESLLNGTNNSLKIDTNYEISEEYYKDTDIVKLSPISVKGKISYPSDDNLLLDVLCKGVMTLHDSVNLELVDYNFSFKIDENVYEKLENDELTLDIISILWENIVLEIPIRYSEVTNYEKYRGDGWKVISEDEVKETTNNPFKDLLKEIEKE